MAVQTLLNQRTGSALGVDGNYGPETAAAIQAFQTSAGIAADGIVSPGSPTLQALQPAPAAGVPALLQPQSSAPPSVLGDADYAAAAATLKCEVAVIKAVATVETGQSPFDAQGRPTILYEQRYFSRLTNHRYDATHPNISSMATGGYGPLSAQYPKIVEAAALDLDNALRSASWGAFQIMGDNCRSAGFATPELMVAAMRTGVAAHLAAFVSFIQADPRLLAAVQSKNWTNFATVYNGSGTQGYAPKLAAAYAANS
jgi:peptidoglycan hydrolase-like protein with peptidoglycan-binding domain